MKGYFKFEFNDDERIIIIKSLSLMRDTIQQEGRETGVIDDILLKIDNKNKIEIDRYEIGIVINSLNTMRNKIKEEQKAPTEINEILLKIIDETDKKKVFSRTLTRGNGRRY